MVAWLDPFERRLLIEGLRVMVASGIARDQASSAEAVQSAVGPLGRRFSTQAGLHKRSELQGMGTSMVPGWRGGCSAAAQRRRGEEPEKGMFSTPMTSADLLQHLRPVPLPADGRPAPGADYME